MKTSNKLLLGFLGTIIALIFFVAFQLKAEYQKINTNDPYRNYERISLKSLKHMVINGLMDSKSSDYQNTLLIKYISGNEKTLFIPKEGGFRELVNFTYKGDTLIINSNINYRYPLPIFVSGIVPETIKTNCASINLDSVSGGHLQISLEKKAELVLNKTQVQKIDATLSDNSQLKLIGNSRVDDISLDLQNQAKADLGEAKLGKISLQMSSSAKISATKENLVLLQKTNSLQ
ncbi:GIN domain-containing protein [Emticicia soli]|uniref:GIN domain-containing protein n=1 Tax=Emticicia soli TaxID=2027878 RepID=A0ABW5J2M5_9BACT